MASKLSENKMGDNCIGARSFDNSDFTHCNLATAAIAQYSALVEQRATMRYFVELQEIGLALRKIGKTPMEVRSSGLLAQSALEKPYNVKGVFPRSRIPRDLVPLR